jgi:hypothetical protein
MMAKEAWRRTDAVTVPNVVGMHIRDARKAASDAGLTLAQPDADGPPIGALTWPGDFWITRQTPPPGARLWKWDSLIVEWTASRGEAAGVREPRRPVPPRLTDAEPVLRESRIRRDGVRCNRAASFSLNSENLPSPELRHARRPAPVGEYRCSIKE